MNGDNNYLKRELYQLIQNDSSIFEFLQEGSLDGIWYWDIEKAENEWLSPKFWQIFGYDPEEKKHLVSEWQDIINQEDLKVALSNFSKHCDDPNHPYDQVVRYRHKDGSTVWIRCRGIAIRDDNGKPIRMLGAHIDITPLKKLENQNQQLEKRVKERTKALEEKTITLKGLLEQMALEKQQMKDDITSNIETLVMPSIEKLRLKGGSKKQIDMHRRTIENLTSSFGRKIANNRNKLSPREIEVCNMVKNSLTNKEIANLLNIAIHTIEAHRRMIRKKLGLANQDINLNTHLNSL